ncbi:hypothetical protein M5689_023161 [Euphorbia peplus]|nr:hypothetical protein M5689_023161 [Euphorbia peplus]
MDYEHANNVITKSRVISRNTSLGCSSRVFYYRAAGEGVPFQWEMMPGTPKNPPKEDFLPPLSPPPAVLSLGLPKPCIEIEEEPNNKVISIRLSIKFWKYIKKIKGIKRVYYQYRRNPNVNNTSNINSVNESGSDEGNFEFCSSDGDFMASPSRNSFYSTSSTSTSASFSNDNSRRLPGTMSARRDSIQEIHGCGPWNFSSSGLVIRR